MRCSAAFATADGLEAAMMALVLYSAGLLCSAPTYSESECAARQAVCSSAAARSHPKSRALALSDALQPPMQPHLLTCPTRVSEIALTIRLRWKSVRSEVCTWCIWAKTASKEQSWPGFNCVCAVSPELLLHALRDPGLPGALAERQVLSIFLNQQRVCQHTCEEGRPL